MSAANVVATLNMLSWPHFIVANLATDRLAARDSIVLPALSHLTDDEGWTVLQASNAAELQHLVLNGENRPLVIVLVAHSNGSKVDGGLYATADAAEPEMTRDQLIAWLEKRRYSGGVGILNCTCQGSFFSTKTGANKIAWAPIDDFDKVDIDQFIEAANAFVNGMAQNPSKAKKQTDTAAATKDSRPRKSVCEKLCTIQ